MQESTEVILIGESPLLMEMVGQRIKLERNLIFRETYSMLDVSNERVKPTLADFAGVLLIQVESTSFDLDFLRAIPAAASKARAILLGTDVSFRASAPTRLIELGFLAYVNCNNGWDGFLSTLRAVARGESNCSRSLLGSVLERISALQAQTPSDCQTSSPRLTPREVDVARLLLDRLTNKQIARRLGVKCTTIKSHIGNLLKKLDVRKRREITRRLSECRIA